MNEPTTSQQGSSECQAMSDGEFARLSSLIQSECGIALTPSKKVMLTVRLMKRLKALGLPSFSRYAEHVESPAGRAVELRHMLDAVSTNKTDFFREPEHFRYLVQVAAPTLVQESSRCRLQGIRVWSAGCASGEEAYTLAMVLSEYREAMPGFRFSILATDISARALGDAVRGVYPDHSVERVPDRIRKKYLLKGNGRLSGFHRIVPELRRQVVFRRHNLAEREFSIGESMDAVFCRNVIIYLGRRVQENLFENFYRSMSPGGYLFIGHSETMDGYSDRFRRVAPTIYRRM